MTHWKRVVSENMFWREWQARHGAANVQGDAVRERSVDEIQEEIKDIAATHLRMGEENIRMGPSDRYVWPDPYRVMEALGAKEIIDLVPETQCLEILLPEEQIIYALINSETMIAEIQQAVAEEVCLRPKEIDIEHQGKICKST